MRFTIHAEARCIECYEVEAESAEAAVRGFDDGSLKVEFNSRDDAEAVAAVSVFTEDHETQLGYKDEDDVWQWEES